MAFVSPLQGHIDVALSNFAVKFRNPGYVADQAFTRVPVQRQSDKYWKFGQEQLQALVDDLRAPGPPPSASSSRSRPIPTSPTTTPSSGSSPTRNGPTS